MYQLGKQICEIGRRAYGRQLVAATEGNFSRRLDQRRILCTPTGVCKGLLTPADLCVIDMEGRQLEGRRQPSSEMQMHLGMYRAAPHIQAIIHTHAPFATTFSVLGEVDLAGVLPEVEVLLGHVPLVPYQTPGTADMASALLPHLQDARAAILQNHGTVSWGSDLESAYALTETLESACRVVYQARQIGEVRLIPPEKRQELAQLRSAPETRRGR